MIKKRISTTTIFIGLACVWLILNHILNFEYPHYFYNANPDINYYIGTNVVSMVADLSFFTYQTLIMFSIWSILLGISSLFKFTRMYQFCTHKSVVIFIFTNYLITTILYTIFELMSGNPTFGLYANNNKAIHNFGTNILGHYIFFIYCLFLFLKLETHEKIRKIHYKLMISYLIVYILYVKISGMYMYNIIWYPYPIFDIKSLFGLEVLPIFDWLYIVCMLIIFTCGYYFLLVLINKIKKRNEG